MDEERVNALVGAEGAAQALGLVPPPPHVGPVESAAYERDRAERAGYVAAVLAAARDAIVGNPHETMRALGRSGDGAKARPGMKSGHPGMGTAAGDEKWAPMGWGRRRVRLAAGDRRRGSRVRRRDPRVRRVRRGGCRLFGRRMVHGERGGARRRGARAPDASRGHGDGSRHPGTRRRRSRRRATRSISSARFGTRKTRRRPLLRRPRRFACTETTAGTSPRDGADRRITWALGPTRRTVRARDGWYPYPSRRFPSCTPPATPR